MRTTAKIFGGFALYNTNYSKPFVAKFKHKPQPIYKYLPEFTDTLYTHTYIYTYILVGGFHGLHIRLRCTTNAVASPLVPHLPSMSQLTSVGHLLFLFGSQKMSMAISNQIHQQHYYRFPLFLYIIQSV